MFQYFFSDITDFFDTFKSWLTFKILSESLLNLQEDLLSNMSVECAAVDLEIELNIRLYQGRFYT